MRQKLLVMTALCIVVPSLAFAHVSVRPREAKPGVEEKYTVRVTSRTTDVVATSPSVGTGHQMAPAAGDAAAIEKWLAEYDAAFNAKDLDKLAAFYHPDVTIYEGGGINRGWADYRDKHLGPELKEFANLQFAHSNTVVRMIGPDAAYATSDYSLKAKMGERDIDSGGLETLVLVKDGGAWKIRHSHTSSRPRRPAAVR